MFAQPAAGQSQGTSQFPQVGQNSSQSSLFGGAGQNKETSNQASNPQPGATSQPEANQINSFQPNKREEKKAFSGLGTLKAHSEINKQAQLGLSQVCLLKFVRRSYNTKDFEKNREHISKMIEKGLNMYKTLERNVQEEGIISRIKDSQDQDYKWSEGFVKQLNIQQSSNVDSIIKNYVLSDACIDLNLDEKSGLQLLEAYFSEFPAAYLRLIQLRSKFSEVETSLTNYLEQYAQKSYQNMNYNLMAIFNDLMHRKDVTILQFQKKNQELEEAQRLSALEIRNSIFDFYLSERESLFKLLYFIFDEMCSRKNLPQLQQMRGYLQQHSKIVDTLFNILDRNLQIPELLFAEFDDHKKNKYIAAIQKEQIILLETLFMLAKESRNIKQFTLSHLLRFYTYLHKTQFSGYIPGLDQIYRQEGVSYELNMRKSKIQDLGTLVYLMLLRIDLFIEDANPDESLKTLINEWYSSQNATATLQQLNKLLQDSICELSAIPAIATIQVISRVNKQLGHSLPVNLEIEREVVEHDIVEQFRELYEDSYLFSSPGNGGMGRFEDTTNQSLQGEFINTLRSFMILIYKDVLVKRKQESSIFKVQNLMTRFLKNPKILHQVWQNLKKNQYESFTILQMFEDILKHPFHHHNDFSRLLRFLCGKQRVKTSQYALDMALRLSPSEEMKPTDKSPSLLSEILVSVVVLHYNLVTNQIDQSQFESFSNFLIILTKMIKQDPDSFTTINQELLTILNGGESNQFIALDVFATGDQGLFEAREDLFKPIETCDMTYSMGKSLEIDLINNNPLTLLLVRSLFTFAAMEQEETTADMMKHILDALSKIFGHGQQIEDGNITKQNRKVIMNLILIHQENMNFNLCSYLSRINRPEENALDYKLIISFIKLMGKVFAVDHPQMLFSQSKQADIQNSFLQEVLQEVFLPLVFKLNKIQTDTIGHYAKLGKRVFKFLLVLLRKFDSGSNLPIQVQIQQHNPRYNPLLQIILNTLNQVDVVDILMEPLSIRGPGTALPNCKKVENQFIAALFESDHGQGGVSVQQINLLNSMFQQIIRCFNLISKLALGKEHTSSFHTKSLAHKGDGSQAEQSKWKGGKDYRSLHIYYACQLKCVSDVFDLICEPNHSRYGSVNLVSLMAFYSKVEMVDGQLRMCPEIWLKTNYLALEFLKRACMIWQIQSTVRRIDFSLLLVNRSGLISQADLEPHFIQPLTSILNSLKKQASVGGASDSWLMRDQVRYAINLLDLFSVCAQSQHVFINQLFSKQSALKKLIPEIQSFFAPSQHQSLAQKFGAIGLDKLCVQLGIKFLSWLQIMTTERVGTQFIGILFGISGQQSEHLPSTDFLRSLIQSLIQPISHHRGPSADIEVGFAQAFNFDPRMGEEESGIYDYYSQLFYNLRAFFNKENKIESIQEHCQHVCLVAEFLKLVSNLYQIEPKNCHQVQKAIQDLFTNQSFGHFLNLQSSSKTKVILSQVQGNLNMINQYFKSHGESNYKGEDSCDSLPLVNQEFLASMEDQARRDQTMTHEQRGTSFVDHQLASQIGDAQEFKIGATCLHSIDCFQQTRALKFLKSRLFSSYFYSALSLTAVDIQFREAGVFGSQFLIPTAALEHLLVTHGCQNIQIIQQFIYQAEMFNLAMSTIYSHTLLEEAKMDFLLQVGRSQLKAASLGARVPFNLKPDSDGKMRNQIYQFLLPLVGSPKDLTNSSNETEQVKQLIQYLQRIGEDLFKMLKDESKDAEGGNSTNFLGFQHSETLLSFLDLTLTYINVCLDPLPFDQRQKLQQLKDFVSKNVLFNITSLYSRHLTQMPGTQELSAIEISANVNTSRSFQGGRSFSTGLQSLFLHERQDRYQKHFQDTVLSAFQVLEAITLDFQFSSYLQKTETEGIINCLTKIVQIMQVVTQSQKNKVSIDKETYQRRQSMFKDCLTTLKVGIDLLSDENVEGFMHTMTNQPLRIIISRFVEGNQKVDIEETILIIDFLTKYAELQAGALHLFSENIFNFLMNNKCIAEIQNQYYYTNPEGESMQHQIRNPFHILWCKVLRLIRTLNENLLDDEVSGLTSSQVQQVTYMVQRFDQQVYLRTLRNFLTSQGTGKRISVLFCKYQHDKKISQALVEETELISCIINQIFQHADTLSQTNFGFVQGLKDCLIFGLMSMFKEIRFGRQEHCIESVSAHEQFLEGLTANALLGQQMGEQALMGREAQTKQIEGGYSLLDMKTQIHFAKIFINSCQSLMNLILIDKKNHNFDPLKKQDPSNMFSLDWFYLNEYIDDQTRSNQFNGEYLFKEQANQIRQHGDRHGYGFYMMHAFDQVINATDSLSWIYSKWNMNSIKSEKLFGHLTQIFNNDDAITSEYYGLNSLILAADDKESAESASGYEQFIMLLEHSIQMGNQLCILLLEKLYECYRTAENQLVSHVAISNRFLVERTSQIQDHLYKFEGDLYMYKDLINGELKPIVPSKAALASKDQIKQHIDRLQNFIRSFQQKLHENGELRRQLTAQSPGRYSRFSSYSPSPMH